MKGHAFPVADAPKTKLHLHRIVCFESLNGNLNAPIMTGSTTKPLIQIYLKERRKTVSHKIMGHFLIMNMFLWVANGLRALKLANRCPIGRSITVATHCWMGLYWIDGGTGGQSCMVQCVLFCGSVCYFSFDRYNYIRVHTVYIYIYIHIYIYVYAYTL